jgi:menaquinone-dependent protoporphyrinogen IX oxidase
LRVAVISAAAQRGQTPEYVKSLAKGVEEAGHQVQVFNAWTDDNHMIPSFNYIIIAAEAVSMFGGKMPGALTNFMAAGVGFEGKKGAAFLKKKIFNGKALINLMRAMEKQGMFVNNSDIIMSSAQAEELGKRISG